MTSARRVAILGAGPMGLDAAVSCLRRGHEPIVLEAHTPGHNLRAWGPTRFFTPLGMNLSEAARTLMARPVAADALLTGPETAELLAQIAASEALAKHVHCNHRVIRITRHDWPRGEHAGHPIRAEMPFRILCAAPDGERMLEADAVLDATGTYGQPVPLMVTNAEALRGRVARTLGELHGRMPELEGARVLLTGDGHSAANAIVALESARAAHVTWAVRGRDLRPLTSVTDDPLPERARIVARANELCVKPPSWLTVLRAATMQAVSHDASRSLTIAFSGERSVSVDLVVALHGYAPDLDISSELPLDISPATGGAGALARALANVTDCLTVPRVLAKDLASGEPRFHMIGAKSYGRASTFLLQNGRAQLEAILDGLFD